MKLYLEWLNEFIDVTDKTPEELSNSLSLSGTEVAGIEYPWEYVQGAVVGRIRSTRPHPESERLLITEVDIGSREAVIVTADMTVKSGETVAVLPEGSSLSGEKIEKKEFLGVESEGMFLSLEELRLEDKSLTIMRLKEGRLGESVVELLGLNSAVIEVELTANRGDCLSTIGMARELGAIYERKVEKPGVDESIESGEDPVLKVILRDSGCSRYTALLMNDVNICDSPLWMKKRLVAAGLRPINNVVDITNYVMLETGHPIHAFDVERIGSTEIVVREARNGEKLKLLDGKIVELDSNDMLITNGETPLALAGVMGGEDSGIYLTTKNVLLEVAVFDPVRIRKTARKLGISTDSSYRFERGIDYEDSLYVMKRLADLMKQLAGASVGSKIVDAGEVIKTEPINLRESFIIQTLGGSVPIEKTTSILKNLGFKPEKTESGWKVTPPPFRAYDTKQEIDLVEEIGRIYGYDNFENELPRILPISEGVPESLKRQKKLKELMVAYGFDEIVTYSFINPDEISRIDASVEHLDLANPLSMDMAVMRPSLIYNLLSATSYNYRRQNRDIKLFEVASVFDPKKEQGETTALGFVSTGRENPLDYSDKRVVDFFTFKGIVDEFFSLYGLTPSFSSFSTPWLEKGKAVLVEIEGVDVGFFGAVDISIADSLYEIKSGEVYIAELNLSLVESMMKKFAGAKKISPFPRVFRDLSFLVPHSVKYGDLEALISKTLEGTAFGEIRVSDLYNGKGIEPGYKSITVTLAFETFDRTLTDEEINCLVDLVLRETEKIGVKLRG
ncbi:MAG TPA: phenylalanine--tRNA ligase subunit beta [Mesotoga infera]|jgi:phenylalanyl-tRNA synthetase beta chain|uniref:Phenylalanine--tRNA ligase beta subunit n=1 Tax=Mesotoga infera TaxID=1236046 RepID=A0A101I7X7_9BACT|nr:MAG: Phenylalanine--tRNA ligase beta subunit [Mesotoga infera]KUK89998.1 MAG: Phenylalanine--tRNA ligase beta subunit [Mesotoga infera]HCO69085.1 phenylalanine--tRNA ligase subunit beta [Mesotoga infera]